MKYFRIKEDCFKKVYGDGAASILPTIVDWEELQRFGARFSEKMGWKTGVCLYSLADQILDTTIRGKTYAERQDCLRNIAIDWQYEFFRNCHDLSYSELAYWNVYFYENGKRYGLIREFEENGIL